MIREYVLTSIYPFVSIPVLDLSPHGDLTVLENIEIIVVWNIE